MKLLYQPHIDGLRALAVLAVIIYHLEIKFFNFILLPGGFLGVDIFFVISGYLISIIILQELKIKKGKFSFLNFYQRRARRIFPALFAVMFLTMPFIFYFVTPNFLIEVSKSIIFSLFFLSNYYFWSLGHGYDQLQFVAFQPFLHTWSLSVEEQFYLLFPVVIYFFYFLRKRIIFFFFCVFVITLLISNYFSTIHASFNFYSLSSRIWQLLMGIILANFEFYSGQNQKNFLSFLFAPLGFLLIIFSFIYYNDKMFLPSMASLPALIGACLIIYYKNRDELITKFLSTKLLVGLGLMSYSLYLWHYPIIIIFKNLNSYYLSILIFLLSLITYFFIEIPFRKKKNNYFYNLKFLLIFFIIILFINIVIILNNGFYNPSKYPKIISELIDIKIKNNDLEKDVNIYEKKKKNIYIVGDSHMGELSKALVLEPEISKYNFFKLINTGCYYVYGFDKVQKFSNKIQNYCSKKTQEDRRENILSEKDPIVILGGRLDMYVLGKRYNNGEGQDEGREWWIFNNPHNLSIEEGIKKSIEDLLFNDVKIILIYPIPAVGFDINKKIFDRFIYNKNSFNEDLEDRPITTDYNNYIKYSKKSYEILNNINHPNLYKIYSDKLFCNSKIKNRCLLHDSNHTFYLDNNHLSYYGNKILSKIVIKKIQEIEKKSN